MSRLTLIASQDDPSVISCYKKGDKVNVDITNTKSLPIRATNDTTNVTFFLKHLDHFVDDGDDSDDKSTSHSTPPLNTGTSIQAGEAGVQEEEHSGIQCNGCGGCPIKGSRFKCLECSTYDLCASCQGNADAVHNGSHTMLYIPKADHVTHTAYCDGCAVNIKGLRFKCSKCSDYDLCETCSYSPPADHNKSHIFMICFTVIEAAETGSISTSSRSVRSAKHKFMRKASEMRAAVLGALAQVAIEEAEKDSSQMIVADVDSVFSSF